MVRHARPRCERFVRGLGTRLAVVDAMTRDRNPETISAASTPELFAGLISDAKELAIGHLGRMRGEIGDEFVQLKLFLAKVAITVGVVVVGSVLLGHALAAGIVALGVPWWAGYLIAAVISFVVGGAMLKRMPGDKKNMDLVPEGAFADLTKDLSDIRKGKQSTQGTPGAPAHQH